MTKSLAGGPHEKHTSGLLAWIMDWKRFTLDHELLQQPLVALKRTRAHRARGSVELSSMEASINRKLRCRHGIHLGIEIEKIRVGSRGSPGKDSR